MSVQGKDNAAIPEINDNNKRPSHDAPQGAESQLLKAVKGDTNRTAHKPQMTREQLSDLAQKLIDQLNQKRSGDSQILAKYKEALIAKVTQVCNDTEKQLYAMYNRRNQDIQETVQKLYSVLESVEKTENELEVFKQNLSLFYRDMNN